MYVHVNHPRVFPKPNDLTKRTAKQIYFLDLGLLGVTLGFSASVSAGAAGFSGLLRFLGGAPSEMSFFFSKCFFAFLLVELFDKVNVQFHHGLTGKLLKLSLLQENRDAIKTMNTNN